MSQVHTVKLSAVEAVRIEASGKTVKLSFNVGGVPVLTKHIPAEAAGQLSNALGFACNDIQFAGGTR